MDDCQYGKDTREMTYKIEEQMNTHMQRMWEAIEKNNDKVTDITIKYVNRLPIWATFVFATLTTIIGVLASKLKLI